MSKVALERFQFQQGEEVEALPELDRLRSAQARSVTNLALKVLQTSNSGLQKRFTQFAGMQSADAKGVPCVRY